ncbi:MAG: hypothetical protein H3C56_04610 [Chitinophagaceae bacterium]|nr:hypothetical protein [Chitinophagaceae bacterium]
MNLLFNLTTTQVELIGYIGSFLTSITFLPQVYQSVGDLSIWMIVIVITSTLIWLVYGFGITGGGPVIVANSVVLVLSLLLLYFKLTFKK